MERYIFQKILKSFSEYSLFAQKAKGNISTIQAKNNLDIGNFLKSFHSFDLYTYALVDVSDLKIVKVGGALKQLTGYDNDFLEGKGFFKYLKLHKLIDIYKSLKGGNQYFKYLYSQEKEKRPFIKSNRTLDLIKKNGSTVHVLVQSIPVLFNAEMEVIMVLVVSTDISELKLDRKFTHYIIDSSDATHIKKIDIDHSDVEKENNSGPSMAELKVLSDLSNGLSSKQIAYKLFLSEHTVKTHRKNMLKKFECGSSSELVRKAIINGWI